MAPGGIEAACKPAPFRRAMGVALVGGEQSPPDREAFDDRSPQQLRVVELGLVREHVAVRVRRDREAALADELADPRPRHAAQVQQADPAVAQVVRGEQRDRRPPGRPSRSTSAARRRRSRRTAARSGSRSSRGPSARLERLGEHGWQLDPERLAASSSSRPQPHPAARLVVVADEGHVDRADTRARTSRARAARAGASTAGAGRRPRRARRSAG